MLKSKKLHRKGTLIRDISAEKFADSAFSVFTRLRDADVFGKVKCCTCHRVLKWEEIQNGHWQGRWKKSTRWMLENGNPQCGICNTSDEADRVSANYERYMQGRWGMAKTEEVRAISNITHKHSENDLIDIGFSYWQMAKDRAQDLGIPLRHASIEGQISFWQEPSQRSGKPAK